MSLGKDGYKFDDLDWFPVKNDSGETIPSFACMRITGMENTQGTPTYIVDKPSINYQATYLINSSCQIAAGKYGRGTFGPYYCLIDPATSGASYGDGWGPTGEEWYLTELRPGFICYGNNQTNGHKRAIMKHQLGLIQGKTSGSYVYIWGDSTTPAATTLKVDLACWMGTTLDDKKVTCAWINGIWMVIAMECT